MRQHSTDVTEREGQNVASVSRYDILSPSCLPAVIVTGPAGQVIGRGKLVATMLTVQVAAITTGVGSSGPRGLVPVAKPRGRPYTGSCIDRTRAAHLTNVYGSSSGSTASKLYVKYRNAGGDGW